VLSDSTSLPSDYLSFLAQKRLVAAACGFDVPRSALNPMLFDWQADIVQWALRRGRAALFADCGLGKTPMQLEWASKVHGETGADILIIAPLAVSQQTVREGQKFGIPVTICRSQSETQRGINITNYEMVEHFDRAAFGGIVLDESSRLKAYDGKQRKAFTDFAQTIPFRLACTATPAPNDLIEIVNHAEFLGILTGKEIIALFFTQDGNTTHQWRLKGHAREDFWKWLASWSVALRRPSDLGYSDDGFVLPPLRMMQTTVEAPAPEGMLFSVEALDLESQRRARRASLDQRVEACATVVLGRNALYNTKHEESDTPSRVPESLLSCPSGEVPAQSGETGALQRTSQAEIRGRSGVSRRSDREGDGVECQESGTAEGSAVESLRYPAERLSGPHDASEPQVCNLRILGYEQAKGVSRRGPRALDGESARASLYQLQSGNRQVSGRFRPTDSGSSVPFVEKWIIWCELNDEQAALERAFGDLAFSVHGTLTNEEKERRLVGFIDGKRPILISKPSVAGYGLNLQFCHNVAFVGVSHSYEQWYQAIRRCWRFGQTSPVSCYVIASDADGPIVRNLERKEAQAADMMDNIVRHMAGLSLGRAERAEMDYAPDKPLVLPAWLTETAMERAG
jgi:Helicase conserved C-terminal domain